MTRASPAAKGLFGLAALVAIAIGAYAIAQPLGWLIRVVPDDTFYYLKTGTNIAERGRSTFDGATATNGYHPAWMLVVVVLAHLIHGKVALLRAVLATALALHVATGHRLSLAFGRWMSPDWAAFGGALWLLNPLPVLLSLQGMEASLYVFALSLALWVYATRIEEDLASGSLPTSSLVAFGFALGFCVLARTDQVLLCGLASLAILWNLNGPSRVRFAVVAGGIAALCVLPWLAYSRWTTGAWVQHSAAMKLLWARKEHIGGPADAWSYVTGEWLTYPLVTFRVLDRIGHKFPLVRAAASVLMTAALVFALARGRARRGSGGGGTDARLAGAGTVLLAATLVTGSIYGYFFTDKQDWYRGQPGLVLFVLAYVAIARGFLEGRGARHLGGAIAGAAVFAAVLVGLVVKANSYPWQREVLESQLRFEKLVPEGTPIGCFNAGIPSYFGDHTVVNLDGLMNNDVFPYYQRDELDRYLADANIEYVADEDMSLKRALLFVKAPLPRIELATASLTWLGDTKRRLYRLGRLGSARR